MSNINQNIPRLKQRKIGWIGWTVIALVVCATIGAIGNKEDKNVNSSQATDKPASINESKAAAAKPVAYKDADITSDSVKAAIEAKLGKAANTDKKPQKVVSVTVNDDLGDGVPNGSKIVILKLNGNDNALVDERKVLLMDSNDVLQTLAANPKLYELDVDWQLPFVDAYGNVKDDLAMQLKFTRPQIDKINWSNFLYDNIPTVAKDSGYYWEHPALTKK